MALAAIKESSTVLMGGNINKEQLTIPGGLGGRHPHVKVAVLRDKHK